MEQWVLSLSVYVYVIYNMEHWKFLKNLCWILLLLKYFIRCVQKQKQKQLPQKRRFSRQFETLIFYNLESCLATVLSLILHERLTAMSEYYTLFLSLRTMKISDRRKVDHVTCYMVNPHKVWTTCTYTHYCMHICIASSEYSLPPIQF